MKVCIIYSNPEHIKNIPTKFRNWEIDFIDDTTLKGRKEAYKVKGHFAARETPFIGVFDDSNKGVKGFYSEASYNVFDDFKKYLDMLNSTDKITIENNLSKLEIRNLSLQEFVDKIEFGDAKLYDNFMHSKVGYMSIRKTSDNPGYLNPGQIESGWCFAFGEGLACRLEDGIKWYSTSVVQSIDWDKKEFTTNNSTYAFNFEDYDYKELIKEVKTND